MLPLPLSCDGEHQEALDCRRGMPSPFSGGKPALDSTVRFGKHVLHPSHALAWNGSIEAPQGTWECTACDGAASIRARGLLLPCTAVPTLANT